MDAKEQGPLSDESMGKPYGEVIRDYQAGPDVKWRFGKPNYAKVNKLFFQHRSKIHATGSLEAVVQKVVKNWEVEVHHVSNPSAWTAMDPEKIKVALNGGATFDAQAVAAIGPYNILCPDHPRYNAAKLSLEESNHVFSNVFMDGFAFEVLEVMSGPPTVVFKWRHFGKFSGTFADTNGNKWDGNGEMVNVYGMCIAKVSDSLRIEGLDIYYNPDDMIGPLTKMTKVDDTCAPVDGHEDTRAGEGAVCQGDKPCTVQ